MAKIYGLFGAMTGKLADSVMVVRNGEQIVRKYQPIVYNPSTQAQVAARAKMKLLSQLSAVLGPAIAIRREGAVTARNSFTKINYGTAAYTGTQAEINLAAVRITKSAVGAPHLSASRDADGITAISGSYSEPYPSRVVYVAVVKRADNSLALLGTRVVNTPDASGNYSATFPSTPLEVVVYAYFVRDNTEAARVAFGNLEAVTAESVAKLITSRTLTESDVTLSETTSAVVLAS